MTDLGNAKVNTLGKKEELNKYGNEEYIIDIEAKNDSHSIISREIVKLEKKLTVLDVGCGSGLIGKFLLDYDNITIDGIEIDKKAIAEANKIKKYRKIYNNSIDEILDDSIKLQKYDVIIFADLLEHLVKPYEVLTKISKYLNKNGFILVSIPNIAHVDVIENLINNNFNYNNVGVLDTTHLRFFTNNSFLEMIKNINDSNDKKYDVSHIDATHIYPENINPNDKLIQIINKDDNKFILQNIFKLYINEDNSTKSLDKLLSNKKNNMFDELNNEFNSLLNKNEELQNLNNDRLNKINDLDSLNKTYYKIINEMEDNNRELLNTLLENIKERKVIENKYHAIVDSRVWSLFKIYYNTKKKIKKEFNINKNNIKIDKSEIVKLNKSNTKVRMNIDDLVNILKDYEIISFDVFDTLILRPFLKPTDLFQLMEIATSIDNFAKIRIDAEAEARKITKKENFEINIFDIYEEIGKYLNIDAKDFINKEFELEETVCYANPYMLDVFNKLKNMGKKIIITSDMYWPKEYLSKLLEKCGYNGFLELFVSCDLQINKGTGKIQKYISKKLKTNNIIHVGDNYNSDIKGSEIANWKTYHYKSCNEYALSRNELIYDNSILNSISSAIKVNYLYNGKNEWNSFFKYGFYYGGMLSCGFLDYIEQLVKDNGFDKILFMARDSKILFDIYNKYYKTYDNDYFIVSRSSMLEISFEKNIKMFINFYFKLRSEIGTYTIEDSLVQTDLKILLNKLKDYDLNGNDYLDKTNYNKFEKMIYDNKEEIIEYFNTSKKYALDYFKKTIGNAKKVLCVDLGWNGTIVTLLREFLKDNYDSNVEIYGTFIGNNDSIKVNTLIEKGIFFPYCFSFKDKTNNLELTDIKDNAKAMFIEAMFTSKEATLLKYDKEFVYGNKTNNDYILTEIHKGIMEYANIYHNLKIPYINEMKISSTIAFRCLYDILKDFQYNYEIFKNFQEFKDSLPRFSGNRELTTIGEILKQRNII